MKVFLAAALAIALRASAGEARLELQPSPVVLGRVESVVVKLEVDEPAGAEDLPLRVAVNVGSFGEVTRLSKGLYQSVYVPPATRFPQVALVAVWRETGAEAPIDFLRIPLHGVTRVPVHAAPGAAIVVEVGGETFGPVTADKKGEAAVSIVVAPGVRTATVTSSPPSGAKVVGKTEVDVPPYNRLTAALVPHAIAADGKSSARLEVFYDLGGADVPADRVGVEATLGKAVFERAEKGRYVYRYSPPKGATATEVKFQLSVQGDPSAKAETSLQLGAPLPARAVLRPPREALAAGADQAGVVEALVFDEAGMGVGGAHVVMRADGQPLEVEEHGHGSYQARYVAPDDYPPGGVVRFELEVTSGGKRLTDAVIYQLRAGAQPQRLTAKFDPSPIPTGPSSEATLTVEVLDAAGAPLSTRLLGTATAGTLGPLEAVGKGVYRARYAPPAEGAPSDAEVKLSNEQGTFARAIPIPLRIAPGRVTAGARAALSHSLRSVAGARFGLEVWGHLGALRLGLTAAYGWASQAISDPGSMLSGHAEVQLFPLTARVGWELWAGQRWSAVLGLGGGAVVARYTSTLSAGAVVGWGPGGLGFGALQLAVGPGHAFVELSYGFFPAGGDGFSVQAGGLELALGYRFRVVE